MCVCMCVCVFVAQFSSVQSLSHVRLFTTPWTAALQASLSVTNSRSPPKPMSLESSVSHVQFFATPWTITCKPPLSMGFPRQEYWSWIAIPFSRGFPQPRDWTWSLAMQANSLSPEPGSPDMYGSMAWQFRAGKSGRYLQATVNSGLLWPWK